MKYNARCPNTTSSLPPSRHDDRSNAGVESCLCVSIEQDEGNRCEKSGLAADCLEDEVALPRRLAVLRPVRDDNREDRGLLGEDRRVQERRHPHLPRVQEGMVRPEEPGAFVAAAAVYFARLPHWAVDERDIFVAVRPAQRDGQRVDAPCRLAVLF